MLRSCCQRGAIVPIGAGSPSGRGRASHRRELSAWSVAKRHPLVRRLRKRLGIHARPEAVPTWQEFDEMDEERLYQWALRLRGVPNPQEPGQTVGQRLLQTLVARDHLQAKYTYATLIMKGEAVGSARQALHMWAECAARGHSWAKANMAKVLTENRLVQRDVEGAIRLYTEAWHAVPPMTPSHAFTAAYSLYGLQRQVGNVREAVKWLKVAADQANDPLAQYQLGLAYATKGELGLEVDRERAIEYTRRSADQGLAAAQHNVACLYFDGCGDEMESDYPAAAHYFALAHGQGFYWSTLNLAIMYASGRGVPRSEATCAELLREVAHFGGHAQKRAVADVCQRQLRDEIWRETDAV